MKIPLLVKVPNLNSYQKVVRSYVPDNIHFECRQDAHSGKRVCLTEESICECDLGSEDCTHCSGRFGKIKRKSDKEQLNIASNYIAYFEELKSFISTLQELSEHSGMSKKTRETLSSLKTRNDELALSIFRSGSELYLNMLLDYLSSHPEACEQ